MNLTQAQKDALTKAGIDWQTVLANLQKYGPMVLQAILAVLGVLTPAQHPKTKGKDATCCDCYDHASKILEDSLCSASCASDIMQCCCQ